MTALSSLSRSQQSTVLIVGAQPAQALALAQAAANAGRRTVVCSDASQAIAMLDHPGNLGISEVLLEKEETAQIFQRAVAHFARHCSRLPSISTWTNPRSEWTSERGRSGAADRPLLAGDGGSLAEVMRNSRSKSGVPAETPDLDAPASDPSFHFSSLIGNDPVFRSAVAYAVVSARGEANIAIEGEFGTGKHTIASAIHLASLRSTSPVRTLDTRGLSEAVLESSLFGHQQGAFVGAFESQPGLLQQCHGGTVILDGADLLPRTIQDRLANALLEKHVRPLGAHAEIHADVRVITLSERSLSGLIAQNLFSEKLYACLGGTLISLPPLRERRKDIGPIAAHFASLLGPAFDLPTLAIDEDAVACLSRCEWRANIRMLQAVLCHAAAFTRSNVITVDDLARAICKHRAHGEEADRGNDTLDEGVPLFREDGNVRSLAEIENDVIRLAMERHGGSITQVARSLRIGRSTLYRKAAGLPNRGAR